MVRAAGVVLLSVLLGVGCKGASAQEPLRDRSQEAVSLVSLAKVERGPISRPIEGSGVTHRKNEVDLSFKVGGVVSQVLVDTGARVKKGQVLAVIDATEVRAGAAQSAELAAKADRDLERAQKLRQSGAVPAVELQNAETQAAAAKAALSAANFNMQHAAIVAPDDGVIDKRSVEVGEVAAPGRPVFRLSGASKGVVLRVALVDRDALAVAVGDPASVRLDAQGPSTTPIPARVSQVATTASPGVGTFDVELRLLDPSVGSLPSGLTGKVLIEHEERPQGTIPTSALEGGRGQDAHVYVLEGNRAKRLPVRVSFFDGARVGIAAGLESIDTVVARGAHELSEGALVRVLP